MMLSIPRTLQAIAHGMVIQALCCMVAFAQTLTLDNELQRYGTLTNTTATLTGRSELHLNDAGDPVPGCLIHLNSEDSWIFFHQVVPSQTVASLLGRVRVNGAAAVLDGNVRVVQYELGSVIIPHKPTFQPMHVFDGKNFTGNSKNLSLYTYYNDVQLGLLKSAVSSFTLKRGYMATVARNENGTGASKVYIAQDSDLEIAVLPANLDNQIHFVRVFPWRWVSKKGWAGSEGNYMKALWRYNWNNSEESTLDREYVPIRQTRWWPGLPNDKRNVTHLLGFNEPDRPDQANLTVDEAIAAWPELMGSGLRLGSPAVSDGGLAWLYEFIDRCDALGYRVDFVPVHFYRANYTDWQLHEFLREVHERTGRPVWVTEFNNGANWTCCLPTQAENATKIGQFIDMMNGWAPYVERYSVFNWVEDNRRMVWDDPNGDYGWPLPAGERYRDTGSPNAYTQAMPDSGSGAAADYLFENNLRDTSGNGNTGLVFGTPEFLAGVRGRALSLDGAEDYLKLPPQVGDSTDFSFSGWVMWNGGGNWQRIFDLGADQSRNLFLCPKTGDNFLRFAIQNGSGEQRLSSTPLTVGVWTHVAVTLAGDIGKLFVNGTQVATNTAMTINPVDVATTTNYIGASQYPDPLFNGRIDEARFFTYALTNAQVTAMAAAAPLQFTSDPLVLPAVAPGVPCPGSLATHSTNGSGGRVFAKTSGPSWLVVAPDGSLTGIPQTSDNGSNPFLVRVTDSAGNTDTATLTIPVAAPGIVARYAFDGNGVTAVGNSHATLGGGPTFPAGRQGLALDLDGVDDLATLPSGISGSDEITVATWVNWDGGGNWQRIFDFGNGTTEHLFLCPKSGSNRTLFLIRSGGVESSVDTTALVTGTWVHVAASIGAGTMRLFINGVQVSSAAASLTPATIQPVSNFIGKSQYAADPFFNGRVDNLMIFNRALSQAEVSAVMNGRAPVFSADPITKPATTAGATYEQTLAGSATDPDAGGTLVYSKAGGPNWLTVGPNGRLSGIPTAADSGLNRFTVRVTDPTGIADDAELGITVSGASGLLAHYQFHDNSNDSQGGTAGIYNGGPVYDAGYLDRAIKLDGTDDHVRLPNTIVTGLTNVTLAARVKWNGGNNWQRIFDFGNNTTQYMVLSPKSGGNTLRFTISINGNAGGEQILESPALTVGEWAHVAVTLNGNTGTLYLNGSAVDSETITIDPANFNPTLNYLGKSQYADPYFNGLIDDFRVYNRSLTATEIHDLAVPVAAVVVADPSFDTWAASLAFPPGQNSATSDPDSDRLANVLEWLLGTNPLLSSAPSMPVARTLGAAAVGLTGTKTYLGFSARLRRNRPGVTLVPEAASNLSSLGTPASAAEVSPAGAPVSDGDFEIFTWYRKTAIEDTPDGRAFIRLKVLMN